jgi:hypothetical protein
MSHAACETLDRRKKGTYLALKIVSHELERVEKGIDGCELDFGRFFFLPGTMDNGCENLVRPNAQDFGFLSGT